MLMSMYELLNHGLHSRQGVVRKGSALLLQLQKQMIPRRRRAEDYANSAPVLANSFPKSGTHLLDQVVAGLPGRINYGAFLSSEISSFQYRLRSDESTRAFIRASLPGEIVRGHLFYDAKFDAWLSELNFVNYFIYRDPRDIAVSTSMFLRYMYPWHRLSRRTRALPTDEDAIMLFVVGTGDGGPTALLPNIGERFRRYEGWIHCPSTYAVRYEDLVGPERETYLREMIAAYAARSATPVDPAAVEARILRLIAPEKSHTFRQGKRGGWQDVFTPALREAFKRVAGDLLVRLGYERDHAW